MPHVIHTFAFISLRNILVQKSSAPLSRSSMGRYILKGMQTKVCVWQQSTREVASTMIRGPRIEPCGTPRERERGAWEHRNTGKLPLV